MPAQTETRMTRVDAARVREIVRDRVSQLYSGLSTHPSWAVAALARLRRAAGPGPGSALDTLEHTLSDEFVPSRDDGTPTDAERAAHLAITLYALHQQSRSACMHQRGRGIGRAVRMLLPDGFDPRSDPHPVLRRFQTLGTSDTVDELAQHCRGVVQLLRAQEIPLDYGLLAEQFTRWHRPGGASTVRLAWGRDFYFPPPSRQDADEPDTSVQDAS